MSLVLIHIWIWFPIYFIFPLTIYFNYLVGRRAGSLGEKSSLIYALNPLSFRKFKVNSLEKRERVISWILVASLVLWFTIGFLFKNSMEL